MGFLHAPGLPIPSGRRICASYHFAAVVEQGIRIEILVLLIKRLAARCEHFAPWSEKERVSVMDRHFDPRSGPEVLENFPFLRIHVFDDHPFNRPLDEQEDLGVLFVKVIPSGLCGSGEIKEVDPSHRLAVHRFPDRPSFVLMGWLCLCDQIFDAQLVLLAVWQHNFSKRLCRFSLLYRDILLLPA